MAMLAAGIARMGDFEGNAERAFLKIVEDAPLSQR
jgi:hypothetical protein